MEIKSFYDRDAWKKIRFRILHKYGYACMACGKGREDGAVISCDHIKPISIWPELALDEGNLQVLCMECNHGKSNKVVVDLRPLERPAELSEEVKEIKESARRIIEDKAMTPAEREHRWKELKSKFR